MVTAVLGEYALALAELAATAAIVAATVIYYAVLKKKKQNMLRQISQSLNFAEGKRTEDFPLPVLVTDSSWRFVWYNHNFDDMMTGDGMLAEIKDIFEMLKTMRVDSFTEAEFGVAYKKFIEQNKCLSVILSWIHYNNRHILKHMLDTFKETVNP